MGSACQPSFQATREQTLAENQNGVTEDILDGQGQSLDCMLQILLAPKGWKFFAGSSSSSEEKMKESSFALVEYLPSSWVEKQNLKEKCQEVRMLSSYSQASHSGRKRKNRFLLKQQNAEGEST